MLKRKTFMIVGLLCLTGCMHMDVNSYHDDQADFSSLQNFKWTTLGGAQQGPTNPVLDAALKESVVSELEQMGFNENEGDPDFLIGYVADTEEIKGDSIFNGTTENYIYSPTPEFQGMQEGMHSTYEYELGKVVLKVVDAKTSRVIWSGSAEAQIDRYADPDVRRERLDKAVHKILSELPTE